jgi:hypothetical protein
MGILLDTCAFLWVILEARELSGRARESTVLGGCRYPSHPIGSCRRNASGT